VAFSLYRHSRQGDSLHAAHGKQQGDPMLGAKAIITTLEAN
jgi:hypothetical protein